MLKALIKKIVPKFVINWYHFLLAFAGAAINGFPSKKLIAIGVTGTKGKSSVVEMCHNIFQEAGFGTASMSTVRFKVKDNEKRNSLKMTMPGRFRIQDFLGKAALEQCKYAVLEVSSEGIAQSRHKFINFKTAVFTNLEPEHIESHGNFEKYRMTKGKLFQAVRKVHVVNLDDENTQYFAKFPAKKKFGYSLNESLDIEKLKIDWNSAPGRVASSDWENGNWEFIKATDVIANENGSRFIINGVQFNLKLPGSFNINNALAAICVGLSEGISLNICKSALEKITEIYGRMNFVIKEPFKVFVDYAHTPNSLEKVYQTFKNSKEQKKLICVLGSAGGGRDKWKRPLMGEIAGKYCDEIIITNEDPYDEKPEDIIDQVANGVEKAGRRDILKIMDRREAINKALTLARNGDVVAITGKGREPWMCVAGGKKIAWDDKKIVEEELSNLANK